jgi:hypothetical protein
VKSVRIVDRTLAALSGNGGSYLDPKGAKRSVEDQRAYFWSGPGWDAALREAKEEIAAGTSVKGAAAAVGWTEQMLIEALTGSGQPPPSNDPPIVVRPRVKRTLKQRVLGLHDVSKKEIERAKRLYEDDFCTVRETAKSMRLPYEKTYLILLRGKTKFRRPGRRAARFE